MFEPAPSVLALDVGTSSVRAMVFDREARPIPEALVRVPHRPTPHAGGGATFDAEHLMERLLGTIDALAAQAPAPFDAVEAVGISTFWHSVVGIDAHGRAVTPLLLWLDMRSAPDAARLRAKLGFDATYQRTGCPLHAAYVPAKLAWLKRTDPDAFRKAERFVSIGELIALRLHGEAVVSPACASASGLLELRTGRWDARILDALGIGPERLGTVVPYDHRLRGLRPEMRTRWPRLGQIPWAPAIGDGATSSLGTAGVGSRRANRIVTMVGTSSSARAWLDGPPPATLPAGLWTYACAPHRTLMGGSLGAGGSLVQWLLETFRVGNLDDAEAEIAWALEGSDGIGSLTFLPYLAGERSPGWHDGARGVFAGVSLGTRPVDFLRAGLEAIAFGLADVVDRLEPALPGRAEVIASGVALLKSPVWVQLLADVLGRPVVRSPWKEASARGAAMVGLVAAGIAADLSEIPALASEPVPPSSARHARYREARARWRELYAQVIGPAAGFERR